jgi:signal transduction histidine kinase
MVTVVIMGFFAIVARNSNLRVKRGKTKNNELQALLEKSQKFEVLGSLTAEVAHDFNNILSAMLNALEMSRMFPQNATKYLEIAEMSGLKGKDIISNLLKFSRGGSEETVNLDLQDIIHEIQALLGVLLPRRIKFEVKSPEEPLWILGSRAQLFQLFMNLCVNAKDAIGENRGRITLEATLEERVILISVTDTGCGIPEEKIGHIFEPLFTTKPEGKGTGLGLFVVSNVVKRHRGLITLHSEVGKGTIFLLQLPRL